MKTYVTKFLSLLFLAFSFGPDSYAAMCKWRESQVFEGEWLECKNCVYQFCQCQPTGRWGNCTNEAPPQVCNWNNPDWTNPACSEGGAKPCDWANPDWTNPSCTVTHPGGTPPTGDCSRCHPNGNPTPTMDPGQNEDALLLLGVEMYGRTCATCHQPLASSTKKGRTKAQIEAAQIFHTDASTWPKDFRAAALEAALKQ